MARRRIKVTPTKYKVLCRHGSLVGERSDCAVIALAAALDVPYEAARATLSKWRKPRQGTPVGAIREGIQARGARIVKELHFHKDMIDPRWIYPNRPWRTLAVNPGRAFTARNIHRRVEADRRYIAVTKDHCYAVIGGRVIDDVENTKARHVRILMEVEAPEENVDQTA